MTQFKINESEDFTPLSKNRWILKFPKDLNFPSYLVANMTSPKCVLQLGKYQWEPIIVELYSTKKHSSAELFNKIIHYAEKGYDNDVLFTLELDILDNVGNVNESWMIHVDYVESFDFGELSYVSSQLDDDILISKMVLLPKSCKLNK